MHIPDGFLDGKTSAATAAFSAIGVGLALRRVKKELPARKVPLLGLAAAFLFTAQMVNFPVAGGTSGHLVGGVLVAALLGPSAAIVVLTTVLVVQCFLFADGGVMALGANIFNMGLVGAGAGYIIYRVVRAFVPGERGRIAAIAFAGWSSTVIAAICCAGELAWSGTVSWPVAFTAMAGVHMLIGIGEGLISALVFLAVSRSRPDLIAERTAPGGARGGGELIAYGALATLGIAVFVAPFACSWPDGLESAAARFGFHHRTVKALLVVPAPDYQVPGIHWAAGATAMAGLIGALAVFLLAFALGHFLSRKPPETRKVS